MYVIAYIVISELKRLLIRIPVIMCMIAQMGEISAAFGAAINLVLSADETLVGIILLSLQVSLCAVAIAAVLAIPIGSLLAIYRFPGSRLIVTLLNSMMGLPPVVLGLFVYLMLSRAGPLGELGILFTPTAMIVAQIFLVLPIIAALTRQTLSDLYQRYDDQFRSFRLRPDQAMRTLIWEGRFSLLTALLAGFGRASAEVGAVMIVGGNINGVTRVMTTTIAMETSKGDFSLALGLGFVLLALVIFVNLAVSVGQQLERRL